MWFARQSEKENSFFASLAGTKHDLKTSHIRLKGLASRTTRSSFLHTKVLRAQSVGANRAQNITLHMRLLSFALKHLSSFSMNLVRAQMDVLLIALTRLDTMSQATCAGQRFWSRRLIGCQEIIG